MDEPGWSYFDADGNQLWDELRLQKAFDAAGDTPLFISGCEENQVRFYPQFTDIFLLSAPAEVISERLRIRTNNPFGKQPGELEEVLTYLETVELLLRRGATHEIITTMPLDQVVEEILTHVGFSPM